MKKYIIRSDNLDSRHNLAYEECLVESVNEHPAIILYLWQNDKAVVIGRNQDAYAECDIERASELGVTIVRRNTGGGAVYHDRGNLNFSIIVPTELYEVQRSTTLIINALRRLGIETVPSGRNDILAGEKKISGSAYYSGGMGGMACLHHGTIMYDVDISILEQVLTPSKEKLEKNRVSSVRSRVTNIKEIAPGVSLDNIEDAVTEAFHVVFHDAELSDDIRIDPVALLRRMSKYCDDRWNLQGKEI